MPEMTILPHKFSFPFSIWALENSYVERTTHIDSLTHIFIPSSIHFLFQTENFFYFQIFDYLCLSSYHTLYVHWNACNNSWVVRKNENEKKGGNFHENSLCRFCLKFVYQKSKTQKDTSMLCTSMKCLFAYHLNWNG